METIEGSPPQGREGSVLGQEVHIHLGGAHGLRTHSAPLPAIKTRPYLLRAGMPHYFPQVICNLISRKTKGLKGWPWNFRPQLAGAQGPSWRPSLSLWQPQKGRCLSTLSDGGGVGVGVSHF